MGFSLLPILGAVSPLLVLPVIGRVLGIEGWAAIAVGQSVGLAASAPIYWGWNVVGPAEIALADSDRRGQLFRLSLATRGLIALPACAVAAAAAAIIIGGSYAGIAALMAVAAAVSGLSPTWFYIGVGQPGKIAMFDSLPRLAAALLSVPIILVTHSGFVYPALTLALSVIGLVAAARSIISRAGRDPITWPMVGSRFRRQGFLAVSALITTSYTNASVALVSVAPGQTSVSVGNFAAGTRLIGMAQAGLTAVVNAFQGWVGRGSPSGEPSSRVIALRTTIGLGVGGGVTLAIFLPPVSSLIFGAEIRVGEVTAVFLGLAFLLYAATASLTFYVLVPLGSTGIISTATIIASVVGAPLVIFLAAHFGAAGAASAIAAAELIVLLIETPVAYRCVSRAGGTTSSTRG